MIISMSAINSVLTIAINIIIDKKLLFFSKKDYILITISQLINIIFMRLKYLIY